MEQVYLSKTGKMAEDVMYEFVSVFPHYDEDGIGANYPASQGWRHHVNLPEDHHANFSEKVEGDVNRYPPKDAVLLRGNDEEDKDGNRLYFQTKELFRCSKNKNHVTAYYWTKPVLIHVRGHVVPDIFLAGTCEEYTYGGEAATVVTSTFAKRLKKSELKGFAFEPIKVQQEKKQKNIPEVFLLHFMGKRCIRGLSVRGVKNACPFCGHAPLICPECDDRGCNNCNKSCLIFAGNHKGKDDKRLVFSSLNDLPILEGKKWDGSDFIYGFDQEQFITKRALDFMLSIHATSFCVRPVNICVDGMSKQQLKQLEEAKHMPQ